MEDARRKTLKGIEGINKEQLFAEPVPKEYCLGAYLMHLGECEIGWYEEISGEVLPDELKKRNYYDAWIDYPPGEGNPPTEVIEVEEYISAISDVRKYWLEYLDRIDDSVLDDVVIAYKGHGDVPMTKRDIINRIISHENHTRGQIFLLARMGNIKPSFNNIWGIRLEDNMRNTTP